MATVVWQRSTCSVVCTALSALGVVLVVHDHATVFALVEAQRVDLVIQLVELVVKLIVDSVELVHNLVEQQLVFLLQCVTLLATALYDILALLFPHGAHPYF